MTPFMIACPQCDKEMKVTEEVIGKKIRCKGCQHVFVVQKPSAAPAATAKKKAVKEAPKEEAVAPNKNMSAKEAFEQQIADEAAEGDNPYGLGHLEEGVARCPRCANAMESEEAVVCLNCGFNTRTRNRGETKKVIESTGQEVFMYRLPGIVCIIVVLAMLIFAIIMAINIKKWAKGSFLENEDGTFWLHPGIFSLYSTLFMIAVGIPLMKIAIKRLITQNRPDEKVIKT